MSDFREDELQVIEAKGSATILKGGLFVCEFIKSKDYKAIFAINFNPHVLLSGRTLIELGFLVNKFNSENYEHTDTGCGDKNKQ